MNKFEVRSGWMIHGTYTAEDERGACEACALATGEAVEDLEASEWRPRTTDQAASGQRSLF